MGNYSRPQPQRLAEKLLSVRKFLKFYQPEMWNAVKTEEFGDRSRISQFENGKATPTLLELLNYTKCIYDESGYIIRMEHLVDDSKDLPLPIKSQKISNRRKIN